MTPISHVWRQTYSRNIYLFLVAGLLVGFTFDGGIYSVLFNLFLLRLGYGPEFIGLVNAAGLLAFALCSLPAGMAGKEWGIVRMMQLGVGIMVGGALLVPLADPMPSPWQEAGLLAGYASAMAGLALFFVNGAPFIMGSTTSGERNRVFSLQMALLSLAGFAGSLFGGRLPVLFAGLLGLSTAQAAVYRYPLLLAALLLLPALALIASSEEVDPRLAEKKSRANPSNEMATVAAAPFLLIAVLVLVRFFQVAGVATTSTFFNVYLDTDLGVSTERIGLLSALGRLAAVPAALLVPTLGARWGNRNTVIWASAGTALSFLPLALLPHWTAAGLGFIGVVGLSALRYPAFMVYSMDQIAPEQPGPVAGAGETAAGLSFALVALVGGYLVSDLGFRALFLLAACLSGVGALVFWAYFRRFHG